MVELYTVQLAKHRLVKAKGIYLLDATAKTGIEAFAPTKSNVWRYKKGELSEADYTDLYMRKLRSTHHQNIAHWNALLTHQKLAIGCYCPPGVFCHRHLLRDAVAGFLRSKGKTVVYLGEIRR